MQSAHRLQHDLPSTGWFCTLIKYILLYYSQTVQFEALPCYVHDYRCCFSICFGKLKFNYQWWNISCVLHIIMAKLWPLWRNRTSVSQGWVCILWYIYTYSLVCQSVWGRPKKQSGHCCALSVSTMHYIMDFELHLGWFKINSESNVKRNRIYIVSMKATLKNFTI